LTAHNDVYGEIFRDLDKLKPGDQVFVSTTSKSYTYVIQETIKVKPTDTWVLDARGDIQQITLISCYPYRQNTQRIVLFGVLQS
jgi:sortase A